MPTLADIRKAHPEYNDMPDGELADRMYTRFYSDMPRAVFNARVGLEAPDIGQSKAWYEKAFDYVEGTADAAANTLTFGLADKAAGLGRMAAEGVKSIYSNEAPDYSAAYHAPQQERQQFAQENPGGATVASIVGALTNPVNAAVGKWAAASPTVAGLAGRGAVAGAGLSAAQAVGENQGNIPDKIGAGLQVAPYGALLGGAIPPVVHGIGSGLNTLANQTINRLPHRQTTAAARKVVEALERDGLTPAQAVARVQQMGPEAALMDVGENSRGLAQAIGLMPGSGKEQITQFLRARQEGVRNPETRELVGGQAQRISGMLNRLVPDDYMATREGIRNTKLAQKLYDAAYKNNKAVESKVIDRILKTPTGKQAFKNAVRNMQDQMEFVSQRDPELTELLREAGQEATGVGVGRGLKLKTLDYVKRAMGDMEEAAKGQFGKPTEQSRIISDLRRQFTRELDKVDPTGAYSQARKLTSTQFGQEEALQRGVEFMSRGPVKNPMALQKAIAEMTPDERHMFRVGAVQALKQKMADTVVRADATKKVSGIASLEEKIKAAFDDPAMFRAYMNAIENEANMFNTYSSVLNNSKTAERMAAMQDAGMDPGQIAAGIMDLKTGGLGNMLRGAYNTLAGAKNRLTMPEPISAQAAKILTAKQSPALLTAYQKGALAKDLEERLLRALGVTGASEIGQLPAATGRAR